MPVLKAKPKRKKYNRIVTGPGGDWVNLFNMSAIMREELHSLVGEHKKVKKGGSAKLTHRLMQEINRVTYCLQAMSWDLDD